MKVNLLGTNIYKSKTLKKGLEFASNNGALFGAAASVVFATVARPLSIYLTPKTDKENRKIACAKSLASSAIGFGLMCGVSAPVSNSIKKIDNAPEKYLNPKTISSLKEGAKPLQSSGGYKFATQLFKLGIGAVTAIPKALITCALVPPVMSLLSVNKKSDSVSNTHVQTQNKKNLTFTGLPKEPLTKGISKIINTNFVQNMSEKFKDSNYAMHITALTDTIATGAFIWETKRSKKIQEERKTPLIYNSAISTGLSIVSSYGIDKALDKPTQKFIDKFREVNKDSPKLEKYVEGIKIAKPILILGSVYYCAIPFISTFFAERISKKEK